MTAQKHKAGLANLRMSVRANIETSLHRFPPAGVATVSATSSPEIEAWVQGEKWNVSPTPFSVTLNGKVHNANYEIQQGVIIVVSEHGTASASASGESNYATAISLLFGILHAAD
jgi:hypothetical protein